MLVGHDRSVLSCSFSPNGNLAASGSKDCEVRIWNMEDLEGGVCRTMHQYQGHTAPVTSIAYDNSGDFLLTASRDYTVRLWSTESTTLMTIFNQHEGPVSSVKYSHDNSYIVSTSHDGYIRLFDSRVTNLSTMLTLPVAQTLPINTVDIHPTDINELLITSEDSVQLYDIRKPTHAAEEAYFDGHASMTCAKYCRFGNDQDGGVIICGDSGGRVYVLDAMPTLDTCKRMPLGSLMKK